MATEGDGPDIHGQDAHDTKAEGGTPNGDESCQTNPIGAASRRDGTVNQTCQTKPIPGPRPRPSHVPAREVRVRKFPNTVKEETYDPHWGRWVWTGYVYANKDSNPADAGRRP
jgi:hypothetical protein